MGAIVDQILKWARVQPEHAAIIQRDEPIGYFEFARLIGAARTHFAAMNFPRGHFAFIFAGSKSEHWVLTLALRELGLNTVAAASIEQAASLNLRNVACVVISQDIAGPSGALPAAFGGARHVVVPQSIYAREHFAAPPAPSDDKRPGGGTVIFTSGSTGTYKKVLFDGANEEKTIRWVLDVMRFDRNSVHHGLDFPPWTAAGGVVDRFWSAGGTVIYSTPNDRFGGFFRHRPTHASLVPAMLQALVDAKPAGQAPLADFELRVGGGFVPIRLAELVTKEITPDLQLVYGSSEVCAYMRSKFETADDLSWLTPVQCRIEIADSEGRECAMGVEGEIRVRLKDFDTTGYIDDPESTAKHYRDGYFYPGDIGVKREDGRIRVLGRTEDVVNLSGFKVAVAPLEETIQRALGVDVTCVFSEQNSAGETEVVIAVETNRRPSDEVLAAAVKGLRGFENVRWAFLDSFPRTAGGMVKVDRRKLLAMLR